MENTPPMPSAILRFRGRVLASETVEEDQRAQELAAKMRTDVQVEVVPGRVRETVVKQVLQLRFDELCGGRPYKKCPKCEYLKDANDFGLRKTVGTGGVEVLAIQAWCRACRAPRDSPL